jgi:hypothetical protein
MNGLEVRRENGRYPASQIEKVYQQYGIVVLKEYLPRAGRDTLRAALDKRLETSRAANAVLKLDQFPALDFLLGDVLAARELDDVDYLFFGRDLTEAARTVLKTDELLYWGDSSIQFGEGARGFHKDNVERLDGSHVDWQGDYGLVRCGFYFQDHDRYSGGLKVRLSSQDIPTHRIGRRADIASTYGDLVFWNMRLTHSGNNRKLRGLSGWSLHPRFEELAPRALVLPEQMRRISAFCSFGRAGTHLDLYLQKMNRRDAEYRPFFQHARNPRESAELAAKYGISFVQPTDYYGELDR